MFKFFLKKISKTILDRQDRFNINLFCSINNNYNKLILCDIGGAGGLQPRWKFIEKKIKIIFFEPDHRSSIELKKRGYQVIEKGLWSETARKKFYLTKKTQTSSMYKPNRSYLDLFPNASRFDIVNTVDIDVEPMDDFIYKLDQPHFIKLDVQGAELEVLKGSKQTLKKVLGLEIEVNFKDMYENIPLAHDIEKFLINEGFFLNDYLNFIRWERDLHRSFGEITHGDALFLKTPEKIIEISQDLANPLSLFENYIKILFIYNKLDLIKKLSEKISDEYNQLLNLNLIISSLEKKHKRLFFVNRLVNYYTRHLVSKNNLFNHWNI